MWLDATNGELDVMIGSKILLAEETSESGESRYGDSYTWTFYKLATTSAMYTIVWRGESNGYYSESADFFEVMGETE